MILKRFLLRLLSLGVAVTVVSGVSAGASASAASDQVSVSAAVATDATPAVHPWFAAKYKELGGPSGPLGSAIEPMKCQASACWQVFQGGVLTSDGRQIVKVSTAYVRTWLAWGGPDGDLGLVAGAESCFGSYCQTPFVGGVIVWVPNSGVFPVAQRWFYQSWIVRGGASGSLGLPTDAMRCQPSACYQAFQKGTLTSSTSGIVALSSAYVSTWLDNGGPGGKLGLVAGAETCNGRWCEVPFERGLMAWEPPAAVLALTGSELAAWRATHPLNGDGDGVFTVATYPDTQQEVFSWAGDRFRERSEWLVDNRSELDLRFVAHTGDVVNWDTDTHDQYVIAEAAMDPLEAAGIPYQLSIGNHDTMATGPGGGARDSKRTREYQRTTTTFNEFFRPSDYSALKGMFEQGKVDNTYSVFQAEGATWLVLNLELWPRVSVVDWAASVISANPGANVLIQTHSFLDGNADIEGAGQSVTRWSYGDSSPQYVYDRLVAPYGNVKVVMSGHVGGAASKVITTAAGNKVAYLLQTIHSNDDNPVRLSQFDVNTGTIDTKVYAPEDGATWDVNTLTGLSFIKN